MKKTRSCNHKNSNSAKRLLVVVATHEVEHEINATPTFQFTLSKSKKQQIFRFQFSEKIILQFQNLTFVIDFNIQVSALQTNFHKVARLLFTITLHLQFGKIPTNSFQLIFNKVFWFFVLEIHFRLTRSYHH